MPNSGFNNRKVTDYEESKLSRNIPLIVTLVTALLALGGMMWQQRDMASKIERVVAKMEEHSEELSRHDQAITELSEMRRDMRDIRNYLLGRRNDK